MMVAATDSSPDIAAMVVDDAPITTTEAISASGKRSHRQLGSQISMFQVCCEMGRPVSTGNSHAKFVTTNAT